MYPLTDEPWGARRFFVKDPTGVVPNVASHRGTHHCLIASPCPSYSESNA
jgi:hypothetical protein